MTAKMGKFHFWINIHLNFRLSASHYNLLAGTLLNSCFDRTRFAVDKTLIAEHM